MAKRAVEEEVEVEVEDEEVIDRREGNILTETKPAPFLGCAARSESAAAAQVTRTIERVLTALLLERRDVLPRRAQEADDGEASIEIRVFLSSSSPSPPLTSETEGGCVLRSRCFPSLF
jgi:hypothetical protein